jgi:hypothetical protein
MLPLLGLLVSNSGGANDKRCLIIPSVEVFASEFVDAIRAKDVEKIRCLLDGRLDDADVSFAFDDAYFEKFKPGARSLRSILGRRGFYALEVLPAVGRANLFLVSEESGVRRDLPVVAQLIGKQMMNDFAICQLEWSDGKYRMLGGFCTSETDAID